MKKAIYNKIFDCVQKNWCYIGKIQEENIEISIHTKVYFDEENKRTELLLCPQMNEIVGGKKDGKTFFKSYAFDIANCLKQLLSNKIKIVNILFASKSKALECDTIIFVLGYRKEEIILKILTRPANDVEKNRIQIKKV